MGTCEGTHTDFVWQEVRWKVSTQGTCGRWTGGGRGQEGWVDSEKLRGDKSQSIQKIIKYTLSSGHVNDA